MLAREPVILVRYPDGTSVTFPSRSQALDAFLEFLEGSEDGLVTLTVGDKQMVALKKGQEVEFTYAGKTEMTTGSAIARMFRDSRAANGPLAVCEKNLRSLAAELERYRSAERHYPIALSALVPDYLTGLPLCPSVGVDTYSGHYEAMENPDAFTIYCEGRHSGLKLGFPLYSSTRGLLQQP